MMDASFIDGLSRLYFRGDKFAALRRALSVSIKARGRGSDREACNRGRGARVR